MTDYSKLDAYTLTSLLSDELKRYIGLINKGVHKGNRFNNCRARIALIRVALRNAVSKNEITTADLPQYKLHAGQAEL